MLFHQILRNIKQVFCGRNLRYIIIAVIASVAFVYSGFDWWYWRVLHGTSVAAAFFPAVVVGGIIPIFGILLFLFVSHIRKDTRGVVTAWALAQAAILGSFISSVLKAFTGRVPPLHMVGLSRTAEKLAPAITDISREFRFGFLRGGVFWGWPSSHTTIAFAMAFTLIVLYPKNKAVKYIAFLYALYVGVGVSMSIHWFSEFAAGAIIGSVIGTVVGASFYHLLDSMSAAALEKDNVVE